MKRTFFFLFMDKEVLILKKDAKRATWGVKDIYTNCQEAQPRKGATKSEELQHHLQQEPPPIKETN